eukprot:CAMPEP_0197182864 /NCGR_PEP_ID=MMETSP1423-20130617/6989_1 /TAXON_ID=476441 /ORGANISM="Pseudo-nitzschia heimii, Strain UNC1101" /LENGTH=142 /DNA_ID=CAMNT_0042633363 /DNA_START=108 /DNA_END=537 /DNA_ORIENTATION=+
MDSRTDKQNRKNTTLDVPWDHYTFNLPGDADLQPALRRKVEILETTEGFCMFYPKQRPGMERNDSSYRSKECEWNAQTVHKGRDEMLRFDAIHRLEPAQHPGLTLREEKTIAAAVAADGQSSFPDSPKMVGRKTGDVYFVGK